MRFDVDDGPRSNHVHFLFYFQRMSSESSSPVPSRALPVVDVSFALVVAALFVAAHFGLSLGTAGGEAWQSTELKWIHDGAKGLLLPLLALRFWLSVKGQHGHLGWRNLVMAAMALCWVGDVVLTFSGDKAFLIGLVSFQSGHVMFLTAFRGMLRSGVPQSSKRVKGTAMAVLFGLLVPIISHLMKGAGDLAPAIGVYAAVIGTMAYFSWVLGKGPGVSALRMGAAFFLVSDLILALGKFGDGPIAHGHFWVMSTYILAQTCLTLGFTAAARKNASGWWMGGGDG